MRSIEPLGCFSPLGSSGGPSERPALRQAELGQTARSLHMGWRGALPEAVSGAKLEVSVCPPLPLRQEFVVAAGRLG